MNRLRDSQGRFVKKESVGNSKNQKPKKEKNPSTIEIKPSSEVEIQPFSQFTSPTTLSEIAKKFAKS